MTPRELAGALRRQLNPRRARWQRPAALVRALRLRRGETVAEIGCGPGYFTARLARAVGPAGHVFAVDPEPAVLDIMRRRLRGVRNVTPVLGREDDPLLPRGRCRTAVLINVYHHMHGGTAFLRRLVASLPRDASVINVDWNETSEFGPPPRQRVPRTRFLRDARRAGLRLVTERTILPHQYFSWSCAARAEPMPTIGQVRALLVPARAFTLEGRRGTRACAAGPWGQSHRAGQAAVDPSGLRGVEGAAPLPHTRRDGRRGRARPGRRWAFRAGFPVSARRGPLRARSFAQTYPQSVDKSRPQRQWPICG